MGSVDKWDDSFIYNYGGILQESHWHLTNTVVKYHIPSNTWTERSSSPIEGAARSACAIVGNRMFIFGGHTDNNMGIQPQSWTNDFLIYDFKNDTWHVETLDEGPRPLQFPQIKMVDSFQFILGGYNSDEGKWELWLYDITTKAFKYLLQGSNCQNIHTFTSADSLFVTSAEALRQTDNLPAESLDHTFEFQLQESESQWFLSKEVEKFRTPFVTHVPVPDFNNASPWQFAKKVGDQVLISIAGNIWAFNLEDHSADIHQHYELMIGDKFPWNSTFFDPILVESTLYFYGFKSFGDGDWVSYNTENNIWAIEESERWKPNPRYHGCGWSYKNSLYYFGGYTNQGLSNQIIKFSLLKKSWEVVPTIQTKPTPTDRVSCTQHGSQVYIYSVTSNMKQEFWNFNHETNEWTQIIQNTRHGNWPTDFQYSALTMLGDSHVILVGLHRDPESPSPRDPKSKKKHRGHLNIWLYEIETKTFENWFIFSVSTIYTHFSLVWDGPSLYIMAGTNMIHAIHKLDFQKTLNFDTIYKVDKVFNTAIKEVSVKKVKSIKGVKSLWQFSRKSGNKVYFAISGNLWTFDLSDESFKLLQYGVFCSSMELDCRFGASYEVDGILYFYGWVSGGMALDTFNSYNITAEKWGLIERPKGPVPTPRSLGCGWSHGSSLFYFSGENLWRGSTEGFLQNGDDPSGSSEQFDEILEFSFLTQSWSYVNASDLRPNPRLRSACIHHNGHVFMFGGETPSSYILNDLWVFHHETNEWKEIGMSGKWPKNLEEPALTMFGDTHLVLVGWHNDYHQQPPNKGHLEAWLFNIETGTFDKRLPFPGDKPRTVTSLVWHESTLYIMGGYDGYGGYGLDVIYKMDFSSDVEMN